MMKERSLRFQLIASFLFVALLMVVVGAAGYYGLRTAVAKQEQFAVQYMPAVDALWTVKDGMDIARRVELVSITKGLGDEEKVAMKKNHDLALEQIDEGIRRLGGLSLPKDLQETYRQYQGAFGEWRAFNGKAVTLALEGDDSEGAAEIAKGDSRKKFYEAKGVLDELIEGVEVAISNSRADFARKAQKLTALSVGAVLFGVVAAVALGILIAGSIGKVLGAASGDLGVGAEQVTGASMELSNASERMAESASEQAASLEESSSALEEMAAMTHQNAENSVLAKDFADGAATSVAKADRSMSSMVESMIEISRRGDEVGKIIKTIDEIAFQTNLLALNAAVEAARAGEAGAGFAVVADEVRNLAQRAASAAKNTGELIEGTTRRIREGTTLVQLTNQDFQEVAGSVQKVATLVSEITAASREQSRGLTEITKALSEMDKVTQANAAAAEEIASATAELSAQAQGVEDVVFRLDGIVKGKKAALREGAVRAERERVQPSRILPGRAVTPSGPARRRGAALAPAAATRPRGGEGDLPGEDA